MPKPVDKSRSRPSAKVVHGVKSFCEGLCDQSIIDAGVGLFIIVALSMLLLRNYQRPVIEQLPVGSLATADILAPEDLKVEDSAETKRLRYKVVSVVLPVCDFKARNARDGGASIQEMFAAGREADA